MAIVNPLPPPSDIRAALVALLIREEGVRAHVYDDATGKPIGPGSVVVGHPTIGVGRALDVRGLTPAEIEMLLGNDVVEVVGALDARLPWWVELSPRRRLVLAAMAFQLGVDGLLKFRTTLGAIQSGRFNVAAAGMRASLWAKQTPARVERMAALMEAG